MLNGVGPTEVFRSQWIMLFKGVEDGLMADFRPRFRVLMRRLGTLPFFVHKKRSVPCFKA